MKIILILIFVTVTNQQSVEIVCYENCDTYEQYFVNPGKNIVLFASCAGKCDNVNYKWILTPDSKNTKQSFEKDDVEGEFEQKLTIKPYALPQGEVYVLKLGAELKPGTWRYGKITLHMDKCSAKYPCEEKEPTVSPDYVGDTSFDDYWGSMNPNVIKILVNKDIKTLESLDKKSPGFVNKRKEILMKLQYLPLTTKAEIDNGSKIFKNMLKSGLTPFDPNSAKLMTKFAKNIVRGRLKLIKNSKIPQDMNEETKIMCQYV